MKEYGKEFVVDTKGKPFYAKKDEDKTTHLVNLINKIYGNNKNNR